MGYRTKISWTDSSWNPIRARDKATGKVGSHCEKVSAACAHCYAETFNKRRLPNHGTGLSYSRASRDQVDVFLDSKMLRDPLRWKKPRKIFVCSMTDLFGEWVPDELIDRMFAAMAISRQHTFQILTKRPERMAAYLAGLQAAADGHAPQTADGKFTPTQVLNFREFTLYPMSTIPCAAPWPLPNVWLGTSVENQATADERIPHLLNTPAAVRFLSCEPLLGPIEFQIFAGTCQHCGKSTVDRATGLRSSKDEPFNWYCSSSKCFNELPLPSIDWVIAGGESGHNARPMHPEWACGLRDQCHAAGVPFFFKQWGEWSPTAVGAYQHKGDICVEPYGSSRAGGDSLPSPRSRLMRRFGKLAAGRQLDGREWDEFPVTEGAL